MRTTIVLHDDIFQRAKVAAVLRGISLKKFFTFAIEHELERPETPPKEHRVKFPILDSKEPGTLHLTNADIEDLLT